MPSKHTYKFAFFALVGIFLMFGNCTAQDKQLHIFMGGYAAGLGSVFHTPQHEIVIPAIKGMTAAAILGTSKELFDLAGSGTPEWGDLGATMIGAAITTGIIIGVKAIIKNHRGKRKTAFN